MPAGDTKIKKVNPAGEKPPLTNKFINNPSNFQSSKFTNDMKTKVQKITDEQITQSGEIQTIKTDMLDMKTEVSELKDMMKQILDGINDKKELRINNEPNFYQ